VCHTRGEAPNYVDDENLQTTLLFPSVDLVNPWRNLLDPPIAHAREMTDEETLAAVRTSNYFDADGGITLERTLWAIKDGPWHGFVPDAYFQFDDEGFDHSPDGAATGWRAFAYYPFPGFFPTNGSADDVLIRLGDSFRRNAAGELDRSIYEINLAIVEALIVRASIPIAPVSEAALGVDLDLDGKLGIADRVTFDDRGEATRMRYVGRARDDSGLAVAVGSFPIETEFLHTVRYLDVAPDGEVTLAPRMKEVRYAKKVRWSSYAISRANAVKDSREQDESVDGTHEVSWDPELGVFGRRGWIFQGFIEDESGALRPQTFEESAFCEGCHGGVGATVDNTFSFARKLGPSSPQGGWFHWSQHDLRGIGDPPRTDGLPEYETYLREAFSPDDFGDNSEGIARFFDDAGAPRESELALLRADVTRLLTPSAGRALSLDRASLAVTREQSFPLGRDPVLAASSHALTRVPVGTKTGIVHARTEPRLARVSLP
jgi:hypothetical protein